MANEFLLFSDSSTSVQLKVPYDGYDRTLTKMESQIRTQESGLLQYKWSSYTGYKVPFEYLTNTERTQIQTWFNNNTNLTFVNDLGNEFSVRIVGDKLSMKPCIPYMNKYKGILDLQEF